MTASEALAEFAASLKYDDLPGNVVAATKRFLIDTLGVGIGGATSLQGQAMQRYLQDTKGPEEATVIGTRLRTDRLQAAFGNGVLIRCLEMEDTLEEAFLHSAPGTIGATLALAEHRRCTGKELLTAVALGYETSVRVGHAVSPSHGERGFHASGTCGSFGATAAASKLLGLTEPQIASALGIVGLQAAGILQGEDPAWRYLTAVDGGRAAHLGVTAALLARNGFPGSPQIFEAPYGFCAMHTDSFDVSRITDGLASEYRMPGVGIKLFPSSRPTHAGTAAAIILKERHNIDPEAIAEVVLKGYSGAMDHGDRPNPASELDAQGSQQYPASVALLRGKYTIDDVSAQSLRNPAIQRLMSKFRVMSDPELNEHRRRHPSTWPTVMEVRMNDGTTYSERVDSPPGSALNPPTHQQLLDKYRTISSRVLPAGQAQDLWDMVDRLENEDDLSRFNRLWEAPN